MWSQSIETLNPYEALCTHGNECVDSVIEEVQEKRSIQSRIAGGLRKIADLLDS